MLGDCAPPQATAEVLLVDFTINPFKYKPLGHNRAILLWPIDQTRVEALPQQMQLGYREYDTVELAYVEAGYTSRFAGSTSLGLVR